MGNIGKKMEIQESLSPFDLLPDEIVLQIFGFLPAGDVLLRVSKVNERFRTLSFDSVTEINYDGSVERWPQVMGLIDRCSKLRRINLKEFRFNRRLALLVAINALMSCPKLEELEGVESDSKYLYDAIEEHGHSLRRLGVAVSYNLRAEALKGLTHLSLTDDAPFDERFQVRFDQVVKFGEHCKGLESFTFLRSNNDFIWDEITDFLLNVRRNLKELCLNEIMLSGSGTADVALSQCQQLKVLKLYRATGLKVGTLRVALRLPNLRELRIEGPCLDLTEADYVAAFSERRLGGLEKLALKVGDSFGDLGLAAIAMSCPELLHISIIGLSNLQPYQGAPVGNDGVRSLLENCPKLKVVELVGCRDVTSEVFVDVKKFLPELESLIAPSFSRSSRAGSSSVHWLLAWILICFVLVLCDSCYDFFSG